MGCIFFRTRSVSKPGSRRYGDIQTPTMDYAMLWGSLPDTLWFWDLSQQKASLDRHGERLENAGSWPQSGKFSYLALRV